MKHTLDVGSQRAPTYVLSFWVVRDGALCYGKTVAVVLWLMGAMELSS